MHRTVGRALIAATLLATPATAYGASRVEQSGTVGFVFSGAYGVVTGDSRFGNEFDNGGGLTVGFKYVLNPHWSVGLSFMSQRYGATSAQSGLGIDKLQMTNIFGDIYYYRDRDADASQYLQFGIGFYRPEIHNDASEILFPSENLLLVVGLGAEVFIRESWGLELSGRVLGYFGDGYTPQEINSGVETQGSFSIGIHGQAGLFFYLLR